MTDKRKLTPQRRKEIAQAAAAARWGGLKNISAAKISPPAASRRAYSHFNVEEFCKTMAISQQLPHEFYTLSGPNHGNRDIIEIAAARAAHIIQLGAEVGLQPAQALASISVRNGNPLIKGDAQLALVLNSGKAEYFKECTDGGDMFNSDGILNTSHSAVCEVKRIGDTEPHFSRFSVADAITAELWGKSGAWQTHRARMLKYKARAFGLRDKFPDVLKGLTHSAEEMEGETIGRRMPATDIAPTDAAQKLTGIIDSRMLHNTIASEKGD